MRWRTASVRWLLSLVLGIGLTLGAVSSQAWRWGYPRRFTFDEHDPIARLDTAMRADTRKYDGRDIQALLEAILAQGGFLGRTEAEVLARLRLDRPPQPPGSGPHKLTVPIGVKPAGMLDGDTWLEFRFDASGRCVEALQRSCC